VRVDALGLPPRQAEGPPAGAHAARVLSQGVGVEAGAYGGRRDQLLRQRAR